MARLEKKWNWMVNKVKENKTIFAVMGLLFTVITGLFVNWLYEHGFTVLKENIMLVIVVIVVIAVYFSVIFFCKTEKKPKQEYPRFEDISGRLKDIKFGFINYSPYFLNTDTGKSGIGFEVLEKIFSVFGNENISDEVYVPIDEWDDIFKGLKNKDYDIVATPLYETRTRIYDESKVSFCIPIFYANIGLYMSKSNNKNIQENSLTFKEVKEQQQKFTFAYFEKEVSESIMSKVTKKGEKISSNQITHLDLLKKINDENSDCNIVAMEVSKANMLSTQNPSLGLINILQDKQILYPVSFVVRKADTALRNFLNLRIIELLYGNNGKDANSELLNIIGKVAENNALNTSDIFIHSYDWINLE